MTDAKRLAEAERTDFLDLLSGLTPEQWDGPTLCTGWRVRDVATHVVSFDELRAAGLVTTFLKAGLKVDRINDARLNAYGERRPEQVLALVASCLRPRGLTTAFGSRVALLDCLIHQQDIRRSLGIPREIPAERMTVALDFTRMALPINGPKRVRGLTFAATDLDWTAGRGPRVEGPAESLMMAIAGRREAIDQLSGPGVPTLAQRIGA